MKYLWKNKYSKTVTDEFSNILCSSIRKPIKIESERGAEWYISVFHNFLKSKIFHH